ncbi:MAG: hypothetical protein ACRD68_07575, partial [Pyrinomonadaceae bacterium]
NYTAEYFNPDGSLWFSEPLEQGNRAADYTVLFQTDRTNTYKILETKSSAGVGTHGIKITNRDTGETLFQGKFKVGKFLPPYSEKNEFAFFVEHDWLLPLGYVGFHFSDIESGGVPPMVGVWLKGSVEASELEGRLFYKGQQIASTKDPRAGYSTSGVSDAAERMPEMGALSADLHRWKLWTFQWGNFRWDNGGGGNGYNPDNHPGAHYGDKNPGEYAVKIYRNNAQVRELKFTVGSDGRIADKGFARQPHQLHNRVLVPVTVVAGAEKWNPQASKTDAFYGNPLPGFSVP